jgi:hypothetical protein
VITAGVAMGLGHLNELDHEGIGYFPPWRVSRFFFGRDRSLHQDAA